MQDKGHLMLGPGHQNQGGMPLNAPANSSAPMNPPVLDGPFAQAHWQDSHLGFDGQQARTNSMDFIDMAHPPVRMPAGHNTQPGPPGMHEFASKKRKLDDGFDFDDHLDVDLSISDKDKRSGRAHIAAKPSARDDGFKDNMSLQPPDVRDDKRSRKEKKGLMRVPDAIHKIAMDGRALKYNAQLKHYIVIDGDLFEEEFQALRVTREKRSSSKDRPFSTMCKYYELVQGEKWAGTGSIFTFRKGVPGRSGASPPGESEDAAAHSPCSVQSKSGSWAEVPTEFPPIAQPVKAGNISASLIDVDLTDGHGGKMTCSLQHFLDITGAGSFFQMCLQTQGGNPAHQAQHRQQQQAVPMGMAQGLPHGMPQGLQQQGVLQGGAGAPVMHQGVHQGAHNLPQAPTFANPQGLNKGSYWGGMGQFGPGSQRPPDSSNQGQGGNAAGDGRQGAAPSIVVNF